LPKRSWKKGKKGEKRASTPRYTAKREHRPKKKRGERRTKTLSTTGLHREGNDARIIILPWKKGQGRGGGWDSFPFLGKNARGRFLSFSPNIGKKKKKKKGPPFPSKGHTNHIFLLVHLNRKEGGQKEKRGEMF